MVNHEVPIVRLATTLSALPAKLHAVLLKLLPLFLDAGYIVNILFHCVSLCFTLNLNACCHQMLLA